MGANTDKREAILAAALELIAEQGFQSSPMAEVARRAGAGVGTIYRYFSGKDDLVNALYLDIKQRMTQHVFLGVTEGMPAARAFKQALHNLVGYFRENPEELSFYEQYLNSPLITSATREEGQRIAGPMKQWFETAAAQELLKPLPAELLGDMIYGAVAALAKYPAGHGEAEELDRAVEAIWDMVRQ